MFTKNSRFGIIKLYMINKGELYMEYQVNDDILQACYKIIDAQKEAISKGKITQAIRCQEQLKIYKQELDEVGCQEVTNYKREKFAELMQTREQVEEQLKSWNNTMKGMYKIEHVGKRKETMEKIQSLQNKEKQTQREDQMEIANI